MMAPEPLRSAMTMGNAEDTSLALPSDNELRSGQQRVLDQVHTIKRSKSKQWKNGSVSSSPTSPFPQTLTTQEFGTFKFSPSNANGNFSRSNSTMSAGFNKSLKTQRSRTLSSKTLGGRHFSSSGTWEQKISASNWPQSPSELKPSRSDPALADHVFPSSGLTQAATMRSKTQSFQSHKTIQTRVNRLSTHSVTNGTQITSGQSHVVRPPSVHSQNEGKKGTIKTSKSEQMSNSMAALSQLTLRQAVEFLSYPEEMHQLWGATFIQQATFDDPKARQEVFQLEGIAPLVSLLRSPNPGVNQSAAGALRNVVFKDQNNKLQVQHYGGIAKALQLLKETDSTETQKHISGLLWNLSSNDELKEELIATALPALTENVLVPFTCWSESANNNIHPDVFYNATGCLRNLSCTELKNRQTMKQCHGLIDSIISYIQSCVAEENPDDKSVENCACILNNLSYFLEDESPKCFSRFQTKTEDQQGSKKSPVIGCFSPKSSKAHREFSFDAVRGMPEASAPSGVDWLTHPKAMQTYLSLLGSSKKDATLEACCGALHNLTASRKAGSHAMSQILVQKLGALVYMAPLLKSPNQNLQNTAMSLLCNMSQTSSLQPSMAKQILPEITSHFCSSLGEKGTSDSTVATTCNTIQNLMLADTEVSKHVINNDLVTTLVEFSNKHSFPNGSKAASLLLYNIWNDKNLQGAVKKLGRAKSLFVNDHIKAAVE